jgi:hypothetical protein
VGVEVCHFRNVGESFLHAAGRVVAEFLGDVAGAQIRRVSDDGVGLWPIREEGIGAEDIFVEVVERERVFEGEDEFICRKSPPRRS